MANRRWHVSTGILTAFGVILWLYFAESFTYSKEDIAWIFLGFFIGIFGAEFPDLDQLNVPSNWVKHRDWFFHSSFPIIIVSGTILFTSSESNILLPILGIFAISEGTHLILDLFPTYRLKEKDKGMLGGIRYFFKWFMTGLTGQEIDHKLVGTYLIHHPFHHGKERKTLTLHASRWYLFLNGIVSMGLGVALIYVFIISRTPI